MITVVRFSLETKPAANRGPASVVQDVVGSLYNACTGVRTADVAHNASGLPPFRLGAVTAAVTVLDDGCLARVRATVLFRRHQRYGPHLGGRTRVSEDAWRRPSRHTLTPWGWHMHSVSQFLPALGCGNTCRQKLWPAEEVAAWTRAKTPRARRRWALCRNELLLLSP